MIAKALGRTLLFGILCVAGCSAKIDSMSMQQRGDIIPAFQQGRTVLDCRGACSYQWIIRRRNLEALYLGHRWTQLAGEISEIGYPEDLAYFWLGQAAEAEGFLPAALRYYAIANGLSAGPDPGVRCVNTSGDQCFGIDVQRGSFIRISRIQLAMRNDRVRPSPPQIVSAPSLSPAPYVGQGLTGSPMASPRQDVPPLGQQPGVPVAGPVLAPGSRDDDIDLPPIRP